MDIDKIYLVYENSDTTEGRGPMRIVPDSGFFLSQEAAWDFADTIPGIMGRMPDNGSWRRTKYPDVEVHVFHRHDSKSLTRKKELKEKIASLREELEKLEKT